MASRQSSRKPGSANVSAEKDPFSPMASTSDQVRQDSKSKKGALPAPPVAEGTPPPPVLAQQTALSQFVAASELANLEKRLTTMLEQRLEEQTAQTWEAPMDDSAPESNGQQGSEDEESVWHASQDSVESCSVQSVTKHGHKRTRVSSETKDSEDS